MNEQLLFLLEENTCENKQCKIKRKLNIWAAVMKIFLLQHIQECKTTAVKDISDSKSF